MSITKRMLAENLTQTQRLYLISMSHHDGFPVLQLMFDDACRKATEEVMQVDPSLPNYKDVLAAKQQSARNIHEFCEAVRKSFLAHAENGMKELEREAEKKTENN